jgi:class 3 adenylate cyclase/tetratricopeptide (TPR) repeat protein
VAGTEKQVGSKEISFDESPSRNSVIGIRRHIPELAIEWALHEPDRLWQVIDGTLCFADISGFTALAERLAQRGRVGGEELIETLSGVFGGMLDCARAYDGMLLKFGGDALLFLFRGEQHALRAANAAVEMRSVLKKAAEVPTSVGRLRLSMSVGLHSGPLHFFLVGSAHRELILAGPDASLATETEGAANAGEIAVSAATAAVLPAKALRTREDGVLLLRWKRPQTSPDGPEPGCQAPPDLLRGLFPRLLCDVLEPGPPDPEHRVACIAFVRFSGTDTLLVNKGKNALAKALQTTISQAQEILDAEGITLLAIDIDRDGGKLFLSSGVPVASEDDEGRMLRALRRLADAGTPLTLQFGVNRGHVFAAEVGTSWRAAYSAMGDTTNTAARICAKAPPGQIYAHPSVLIQSRTKFATEQVGPFTFKGKTTAQELYQVGVETGARGEQRHSALPIVDRRHELRTLRRSAEQLAAGMGGVVSIVGATGLGKSRLLREILPKFDTTPIIQLRGEPNRLASPYSLLRDPIRALLSIDPGKSGNMAQQLQTSVERLEPELIPMLALLGDVTQIDIEPSADVAAIEPNFRPNRVADTVVQLIGAALPGPLVISVEDAQWADEASAHVLERLSRACGERHWLMLTTRRDDAGGFQSAAGETITLEPLAAEAIEALVIAATASAPLRPHEVQRVVERAGGNPLFAEEIIRAAREAGSVEAVPESLEAAMAAQVDALDIGARQMLRYATVLGNSFQRELLEALLESEKRRVDRNILSRLQDFIVPEGEHRFRFRNDLFRNTIYEGLAYRLRGRLHLVAGEMIEELAEDPNTEADNLALHFSIAGDFERTWRYARIAGDRARRAYANPEAARLYEIALDAARRLPAIDTSEKVQVWTKLGEVREWAGMFDAALDAFRHASRLVGDDALARAGLLLYRAHARERAGAFSMALRELTTARRLIKDLDSRAARQTRAQLASFTAMIRFGQEHYRDAFEKAQAAIQQARSAGNRAALAEALYTAGSAQQAIGEGDTSHIYEALAIYEELGDLSREANVRGNLGCADFVVGKWDEALDWFKSQREICLRAGNVAAAAAASSNIGEILVKRRQFDEAEPILRDTIRVMRASEFNDGAAYAEIQLARMLIELGKAGDAEQMMARVAAEFTKIGQALSVLEAVLVQSLAKTAAGDAEAALRLIDKAAGAVGEDARLFQPQIAEARSKALAAIGNNQEATETIETGMKAARYYGLPYEEGLLLLARIQIARNCGVTPDPQDIESSEKILGGLGIKLMPRPHESIS